MKTKNSSHLVTKKLSKVCFWSIVLSALIIISVACKDQKRYEVPPFDKKVVMGQPINEFLKINASNYTSFDNEGMKGYKFYKKSNNSNNQSEEVFIAFFKDELVFLQIKVDSINKTEADSMFHLNKLKIFNQDSLTKDYIGGNNNYYERIKVVKNSDSISQLFFLCIDRLHLERFQIDTSKI